MSAVYKRSITTFLRVVAAGSFNKDAESASLTAAAVIKQVKSPSTKVVGFPRW